MNQYQYEDDFFIFIAIQMHLNLLTVNQPVFG